MESVKKQMPKQKQELIHLKMNGIFKPFIYDYSQRYNTYDGGGSGIYDNSTIS